MGRILAVILSLAVLAGSIAIASGGARMGGLIADAPVRVQNFA